MRMTNLQSVNENTIMEKNLSLWNPVNVGINSMKFDALVGIRYVLLFFQVKLINMRSQTGGLISRVSVEQIEVAWTCTVQRMNND